MFTPETLSVILQDKLREEANSCFKYNIKEELSEKSLGRNYDLSVAEYKVAKEAEHLEALKEQAKNSDTELYAAKLAHSAVERMQNEQLEAANNEIHNKKSAMVELDWQISRQKSKIKEYEERISKLEAFQKSFTDLKEYITSYLPLSPLIEEYANTVEHRGDVQAGNSFRGLLNAIGELLKSFKDLIVDGLCWFPRLMIWNTSKGEVAPVFSDYQNEGYNYRLVAYRNLVTKEQYSIDDIQEAIKAENRIGSLEQLNQRTVEGEKLIENIGNQRYSR